MRARSVSVLPGSKLTLKDRLSRLTLVEAGKVLGPSGQKEILRAANIWDIIAKTDVFLGEDLLRVRFPGESPDTPVIVTFTLMAEARNRLFGNCDSCGTGCEHLAATLSYVLEQKTALGLAEAPAEKEPVASLGEDELVKQALAERAARAATEKMIVKPDQDDQPWTDYSVTNRLSGKSYRVALRGLGAGDSFCTCPDFRTNTLGTCKHILKVIASAKRRFPAARLKRKFVPKQLSVYLEYGKELSLRLLVPPKLNKLVHEIVAPLLDSPIANLSDLLKRVQKLEASGEPVLVYPDAEQYIHSQLVQARLRRVASELRKDPQGHPLRKSLLKVALLPYQLDGIGFAAGAGRAVLADEMGLGKTIQGVGTAEFLAKEAEIKKVLVICPASLKSQWRNEIRKFTDRSVQLITGPVAERANQYANESFFTVCNYEQVMRDTRSIDQTAWDLIILDEGQRIKNWESKTSRMIKTLRSRFALVLTGTPLENRLDDLYSVVQFVDDRRLGPGFRFFSHHRVVDSKGKVLGFKNLADLREALKPILLRRTRDSVQLDLPPRTTEIVRIPPTEEQLLAHAGQMQLVAQITSKKFLTEMDLMRLQKALLFARMYANSTTLVDKKKPGFSSKLLRIDELLGELLAESDRKIVLFSEWTSMLDLIEPLIKKHRGQYVRLDGSVPQKEREALVQKFQTNDDCQLFITTNAGSVGLNLQSANTVINVDLPWNPAVLEQRIARAHRMGQKQHVQVYVLVTEQTIEENLLRTLASKKDLALAALDAESDIDEVLIESGLTELKSRLEVLLGAKPEAGLTAEPESQVLAAVEPIASERRERVAAAGGELLGAAFKLLGELIGNSPANAPSPDLVNSIQGGLEACSDGGERPTLTISFPNTESLNDLAQSLARLLTVTQPAPVSASAVAGANRLAESVR
jgi:superfamily II DNA or RNA helicase